MTILPDNNSSNKRNGDDEESNVILVDESNSRATMTSKNETRTAAPRAVREPIRWCEPGWKKIAWGIFVLTLVILFIVLLATSLQKLKSTEYGLSYTKYSKKLDDAARTGGLHVGPPGYKFIKFPSTFITVDLPTDICVTQDGLRVQFDVTFQYQMPAQWLLPAVTKYRDYEKWSKVVEAAGNSAVQHSCSEFQVSNFQNKRAEIQSRMQENLTTKLEGTREDGSDGVFAKAISLQLRNVDLPDEYTSAVADKQAAEEDITLAKNQRVQETTKAQTTLLAAREEARIVNNTAVNEADILLTEAMIKAEETTFAFETEAGVIVQVKERLNLTNAGVLAYLSNRLYANATKLTVKAEEPARLSRIDEL